MKCYTRSSELRRGRGSRVSIGDGGRSSSSCAACSLLCRQGQGGGWEWSISTKWRGKRCQVPLNPLQYSGGVHLNPKKANAMRSPVLVSLYYSGRVQFNTTRRPFKSAFSKKDLSDLTFSARSGYNFSSQVRLTGKNSTLLLHSLWKRGKNSRKPLETHIESGIGQTIYRTQLKGED